MKKAKTSPDRPSALNAALSGYRLLALCAMVVVVLALMDLGLGEFSFFVAGAGLLAVLFMPGRAPVVFLVVLIVALLVHVATEGQYVLGRGVGFSDMLLALALLTFSAASYRLEGLRGSIFPRDPRDVMEKPGTRPRRRWLPARLPGLRSARTVAASEISAIFVIGVIGLAASLLLWFAIRSVPAVLSIPPPVWRLVLLAWGVIVVGLVVSGVFAAIAWRQLTAREAAVWLQDQAWMETHLEQGKIQREIARERNRHPAEEAP